MPQLESDLGGYKTGRWFIQDGKRLDTTKGIDPSRPYSVIENDGSQKFVTPEQPQTQTVINQELANQPAPINRAPVVPESTPPPATPTSSPSTVADYIDPAKAASRYADAVTKAKQTLDQYYGNRFSPGSVVNDSFISRLDDPNIDTQTMIEYSGILENSDARNIVKDIATQVWDNLTPQQRTTFVGEAQLQADRFGADSQTTFSNKVATNDGQREVFSDLLDFVTRSPSSVNDNLVGFYQNVGLITKRSVDSMQETPKLQTNFANIPLIGKALDQTVQSVFSTSAEGVFLAAITRSLTDGNNLQRSVLSDYQIQAMAAVKSIIDSSNTPPDNELQIIQKVKDGTDPLKDEVVSLLDTKEIGYLRNATPELAALPIDQFMQLLSVKWADIHSVGSDIDYPRMSLAERSRYGVLTPAEQTWYSLGLSQSSINAMREWILKGGVNDVSPELRRLADQTKIAQSDQQKVVDWLSKNVTQFGATTESKSTAMDIPRGLITDSITPEFLASLGYTPDEAYSLTGTGQTGLGRAVSLPFKAAGFVLGKVGDLVGQLNRADQIFHDSKAEHWLGDPTTSTARTTTPLFAQPQEFVMDRIGINDFAYASGGQNNPREISNFALEYQPNGYYRNEMTRIYTSPFTSVDERNAIEQIQGDLLRADSNDQGEYVYPNMKLFVDLVESGIPIMDAISQVRSWGSMFTQFAMGLDATMMFYGGYEIASEGLNKGVRSAFRISQYAEEGVPSLGGLRAGTAFNLADNPEYADLLQTRKLQLESQIGNEATYGKTVYLGDTKGLGTVRMADSTYEMIPLSTNRLDALTRELDEVNRVIDTGNTGADIVLRENILDPTVLPVRYHTGNSISDIFQIYKPLKRVIEPATGRVIGLDDLRYTRVGTEESTISSILHYPFDAISRLFSGTGLRNTEFSLRASVTSYAYSTTDEVAQILRKINPLPLAETSFADDGQAFIRNIRGIFDDLQKAGKNDEALAFARKYGTHTYETDRLFKTAELFGNDINLDGFRTLNSSTRIARTEEDLARLQKEAADAARKAARVNGKFDKAVYEEERAKRLASIFTSEDEYMHHLIAEVNSNSTAAIAERVLGKSWSDVGAVMSAQNSLNSVLSMFMLESPGFVIRNMLSNFSAGTLDGLLPWKLFNKFNTPDWMEGFRTRFGSLDPVSYSFSPKGLGYAEIQELRQTWADALFTSKIRGGGVPFVGGLPYTTFRKASAHFEAVNRMRITKAEATRVAEQLLTRDTMLESIRLRAPEAARLLDRIANSGTDAAQFYDNLFRAVTDQNIYRPEDIVRYISNITDTGEFALSVDLSPWRLADDLGFHAPHLNPDAMDRIRSVMTSYDPSLSSVSHAFADSKSNALAELKNAAAEFGMEPEAVDDIISIYDTLFRSAKAAGVSPKEASDFALKVSVGSSFRLRGLYERNSILLKYLDKPDLYRDAVFPYAKGISLTNAQLADMVHVPSTSMINKQEIFRMLTQEDEMMGWRGASDIIDAAKQVKAPFGGTVASQELTGRIQRATENLSQLKQAVTRATAPRSVTSREKALNGFIEQFQRDFNPAWPKGRIDAFLDDQVVKFAEVADPSTIITANPNSTFVKTYMKGANPADIRRAISRAIDDGRLQNKLFERFKKVSVSPDRFRVEFADQIRPVPSASKILSTQEMKDVFAQYVEDITYLADAVSHERLTGAESDIRALKANLSRSRKATVNELKKSLTTEISGGNTDIPALIDMSNSRLNSFAERYKERLNKVTDSLNLAPAPINADQEAYLLGRFHGENAPDYFTQAVASNAPTLSFLDELIKGTDLSTIGQEKYAAIKQAFLDVNKKNAEFFNHPYFTTVKRAADEVTADTADKWARLNNEANASAIRWAQRADPYPEYAPSGWTRKVAEPTMYKADAPVAQIPEGMDVAPANIGMEADPSLTGDLPASGVMGRVFYQRPPTGYRAMITGDDWARIPGTKNYGTRIAVFVKDGTPQSEVEAAIARLADEHFAALKDVNIMAAVKASKREALQQNPIGFYASYQTKSASQVVSELKPFVTMAEQGDETAMAVVQYARNQWRSGWPISGHPNRTLQDLYDNFKTAAKADLPFGPYYMPISQKEGMAIIDGIKQAVHVKNQVLDVGMELGKARADWILHNYNNVNDLDWIMRWLGPWHIWPTRTAGKLLTRVLDNPWMYVGYKGYSTALAAANESLPDYMSQTLPVGFVLGALQLPLATSKMGLGQFGFESANLNVNSLLFYNDLIGSYDVASPDATRLGKTYDSVENFIPLNPLYGWALNLTGQFGTTDKISELDRLIRPAELLTQVVSEIAAADKLNIPTQVFMSKRDINDVNLQFAADIMAAAERGGTDPSKNQELSDLMAAFDEWGRQQKGGFRIPLLQSIGAAFGVGDMNPTLVGEMRRASRTRNIGNATSYLGGNKLTIYAKDKQEFYTSLDELRSLLSGSPPPTSSIKGLITPGNIDLLNRPQVANPDGTVSTVRSITIEQDGKFYLIPTVIGNKVVSNKEAIDSFNKTGKHLGVFDTEANADKYAQQLHNQQAALTSDAARSRLISDWFKDNPAVSAYLRNSKDSADLNAMSQAEGLWYSGIGEINDTFDTKFAQLQSTGSNVTSEDNAAALTRLYLEKDAKIAALAKSIDEQIGINPSTDPHFSLSYRISSPELADILSRYNIDTITPIVEANGSFQGESTRILEHIDLLAGGAEKDALVEEVKAFAKKNNISPESVTIGQINKDRVSTEATSIMVSVDEASKMTDFYYTKDGNYTNAIDVGKMISSRNDVLNGLPDSKRRLYDELSARSLSPEQLADRAINNIVGNYISDYNTALSTSLKFGFSSDQIANALETIKSQYKPPTVDDVMKELDSMTQGLWRQNNDLTDAELRDVVQARLDSAYKIGDFNTILTGNYDDNIGALDAGLTQLDDLRSQPQTPDVIDAEKALTGYYDNSTDTWVAGSLREFSTPSGYVITTRAELDEFKKAYDLNKALKNLHDQGIHIKLDAKDFEFWSKYFNSSHVKDFNTSEVLDYLSSTGQWQLFDAASQYLLNSNDKATGTYDQNVYNPDGSIKPPVSGVKSAGTDVTRLGSTYRVDDLGVNAPLSRAGSMTKAYLSSNFTGAKAADMPPDYIFELLARNGVSTEQEVSDFFWSVYEAALPVFNDLFNKNDDVAYTLFTYTEGDKDSNGRPKVSEYQYLLGIRGLIDTMYGYRTKTTATITTSSGSKSTVTRDTGVKSRAVTLPSGYKVKQQAASPTTTGVGGLPQWKEAMNFMTSVFHDTSLVEDVILYFQRSNHRLTNNHMRMLRAMYKTFPIGSASTFDEWMTALKLMFQTADLVTTATKTVDNPAGSPYFDNPPRLANYRN